MTFDILGGKVNSFYEEFSKLRGKVLRLRKDFREIKKDIDVIDKRGFGVLSDRDIKSRILEEDMISPVDFDSIQPASVDLHLGDTLMNLDDEQFNLDQENYTLKPGEFILASTLEYVKIPTDLVGQVDGKSSVGRLGIDIHKTAGWIDPNFRGNITLEIKNDSDKPFSLQKGMSIGQIIFFTLTSPCERWYGHPDLNNHYQDSNGTIASRYEYEEEN